MVWRIHRGKTRRINQCLLMKTCRLPSGGVVMTSEKQQERPAESGRAETGWLQPQVRAEPPVLSFLWNEGAVS